MPFKSEKQKRFMFARKPEVARKWAKEGKANVEKMSPDGADLHVSGGLKLTKKRKMRRKTGKVTGS